MIYVLVLGLALALSALSSVVPRMARGSGLLLGGVLIALAGLRGDSTDYQEYVLLFDLMQQARDFDWATRIFIGKDPLFGALMDSVQLLGLGPQAMFASAAVLSVGLKQNAFSRAFGGSPVPLFVTLCLYYFLHDFTQMRAAIAVGFCFIALVDLCEGRRVRWIIFALAAIGFHASAVIFLVLCLPFLLRGRQRTAAIISCLLAIGYASTLLSTEFGQFDGRVAEYADLSGTSITPLLVGVLKLVWLSVMVMRSSDRRRHDSLKDTIHISWAMCAFGLVLLLLLRGSSTVIAFRMYELLDSFSIFVVAFALLYGSSLMRVLAIAYCTLGIANQAYVGLLVPYSFAG